MKQRVPKFMRLITRKGNIIQQMSNDISYIPLFPNVLEHEIRNFDNNNILSDIQIQKKISRVLHTINQADGIPVILAKLTWDLSLMQYSCIIHSVLSPLGARPMWKTRVLLAPITLEPDFTLRSFPVAFQ